MENLRERQGADEPVEVAHLGSHVHCPRCAQRARVLNRPCRAWPPPVLPGGVMVTTAYFGLAHCEHCDNRPFSWSCRSLTGPPSDHRQERIAVRSRALGRPFDEAEARRDLVSGERTVDDLQRQANELDADCLARPFTDPATGRHVKRNPEAIAASVEHQRRLAVTRHRQVPTNSPDECTER